MGADSKRTQRQTLDSEMYVRCTSWHETLFSGGTYMKRLWSTISLITLAVVVLSPAGAVFAQSMNAGDIRGIVTDTTGAAVPGVIVSVVNKNTGVAKELVTNQDGLYDTSSIVAGSYEVTFSKAGFSKLVRSNITVDVGNLTVNAQLSVGAVTEQVIVNTDVPLLQTENAEQSTTLQAATLQQLPEVGQDWQHFTILLPGATGAPGGAGCEPDCSRVRPSLVSRRAPRTRPHARRAARERMGAGVLRRPQDGRCACAMVAREVRKQRVLRDRDRPRDRLPPRP